MIELKESTQNTIRREVFQFDQEYGEHWPSDTWTRIEVNGELDKWLPHDGYGAMPEPVRVEESTKDKLESVYQKSGYQS